MKRSTGEPVRLRHAASKATCPKRRPRWACSRWTSSRWACSTPSRRLLVRLPRRFPILPTMHQTSSSRRWLPFSRRWSLAGRMPTSHRPALRSRLSWHVKRWRAQRTWSPPRRLCRRMLLSSRPATQPSGMTLSPRILSSWYRMTWHRATWCRTACPWRTLRWNPLPCPWPGTSARRSPSRLRPAWMRRYVWPRRWRRLMSRLPTSSGSTQRRAPRRRSLQRPERRYRIGTPPLGPGRRRGQMEWLAVASTINPDGEQGLLAGDNAVHEARRFVGGEGL